MEANWREEMARRAWEQELEIARHNNRSLNNPMMVAAQLVKCAAKLSACYAIGSDAYGIKGTSKEKHYIRRCAGLAWALAEYAKEEEEEVQPVEKEVRVGPVGLTGPVGPAGKDGDLIEFGRMLATALEQGFGAIRERLDKLIESRN